MNSNATATRSFSKTEALNGVVGHPELRLRCGGVVDFDRDALALLGSLGAFSGQVRLAMRPHRSQAP